MSIDHYIALEVVNAYFYSLIARIATYSITENFAYASLERPLANDYRHLCIC